MVLTIDETLDHYFKVYPRNTKRWFNKIMAQMHQNPWFAEIENEQALRKEEEEKHSMIQNR